jgi:short subunit dehydrogenase-like uncharacterized protein
LGLECRVFDLQNPNKVESALKDMTVLLHCAGPYLYTSKPMVDACLQTGTHYLDITGEIPVYDVTGLNKWWWRAEKNGDAILGTKRTSTRGPFC